MQFYLNGYTPGDPSVAEAAREFHEVRPGALPRNADVLIIGCGPAGLVLAAQLASFPEIATVLVDRKDGPLEVGQADGVACRTVEMFEALGLADRLLGEAYWVNEVSFWGPDPRQPTAISRAGRIRDTEEGISEFPHVIVNQARMLAYLREHMLSSASRLTPFYGLHASDIAVDPVAATDYPVTVTLEQMSGLRETGAQSTIDARYVVGCDGAGSVTRRAIGRELVGEGTNELWGVMDVLAVTDFPDIRVKCAIHSADGNILIIPREGGYLVRLYIELSDADDERLGRQDVTPEKLARVANRIMRPYELELKDVGWWSVYEIGQRLCEKFDDVPTESAATRHPRVFIAGDACHTHSAKAGQGMNVSMADTWNLGWKLAAVLRGRAGPALLHTYSEERQAIAKQLIDFDREFSGRFRVPTRGADETGLGSVDPEAFERYFAAQGRFTAGVATRYAPSMITAAAGAQELARGFPIGMRFHSAPVVRLADGKPLQLGHVARADGAWRLYVFADSGDPTATDSRVIGLCRFLHSAESPIERFTPPGEDPDSVIDVRAIFQQSRGALAVDRMPPALLPRKGRFGLIDYEKMFCPDPDRDDIFELRGIDRERGCVVVVRPDQYVSHILALDEHRALSDFFAGVLIDA